MRYLVRILIASALLAISVHAADWPQPTVRKSLDYLYNRIVVLTGVSNFVSDIYVTGGIITSNKFGTAYNLGLTTNGLVSALSNHFLRVNQRLGGVVSGPYSNLQFNATFGGVVSGPYNDLVFSVPVLQFADSIGGILTSETVDNEYFISLTTNALITALTPHMLGLDTVFDGVIVGNYSNLSFAPGLVWSDYGLGDMKQSDYDQDSDGRVDAVGADAVDSIAIKDGAVSQSKIAEGAVGLQQLYAGLLLGDVRQVPGVDALRVEGLYGLSVPDPAAAIKPSVLGLDAGGNWAFLTPGDMFVSVYDTINPLDGRVDAAVHALTADNSTSAAGLNNRSINTTDLVTGGILTYNAVQNRYDHKVLSSQDVLPLVLPALDVNNDGVVDNAEAATYASSAGLAASAVTAAQILGIPVAQPLNQNTVMFFDAANNSLAFGDLQAMGAGDMYTSRYDPNDDGLISAFEPQSVQASHIAPNAVNSTHVSDGTLDKADVNASILTVDTTFSGDISGTRGAISVNKLKGASLPTPTAGDHGKMLVYSFPGAYILQDVPTVGGTTPPSDLTPFYTWLSDVYAVDHTSQWDAINALIAADYVPRPDYTEAIGALWQSLNASYTNFLAVTGGTIYSNDLILSNVNLHVQAGAVILTNNVSGTVVSIDTATGITLPGIHINVAGDITQTSGGSVQLGAVSVDSLMLGGETRTNWATLGTGVAVVSGRDRQFGQIKSVQFNLGAKTNIIMTLAEAVPGPVHLEVVGATSSGFSYLVRSSAGSLSDAVSVIWLAAENSPDQQPPEIYAPVFGTDTQAASVRWVDVDLNTYTSIVMSIAGGIGYLAAPELVTVTATGFAYQLRSSAGIVASQATVAWSAGDPGIGLDAWLHGFDTNSGDLRTVVYPLGARTNVITAFAGTNAWLSHIEVVVTRNDGFDYRIRGSAGVVTNAATITWAAGSPSVGFGLDSQPGLLKTVNAALGARTNVLIGLAGSMPYLACAEIANIRPDGFDYLVRTSAGATSNSIPVYWCFGE